jgi:hypothetical protein
VTLVPYGTAHDSLQPRLPLERHIVVGYGGLSPLADGIHLHVDGTKQTAQPICTLGPDDPKIGTGYVKAQLV